VYQEPVRPGPNPDVPTPDWPTAPPTSAAWQAPPAPELPTGNRRSTRVTVAAVTAAVLLLVLTVNGLAVLTVRGQQRSEMSRLDKKLTAHRLAQQKAREDLQARFRQADLPGKLRTVRSRDEAATAALVAWGTSGQSLSGLKTVRQARNECADAVIDYNATAARFPNDMLTGLPQRITLSDETIGCGR
jgi:hypothetical protein